jgi:hypothetical protein
MEMPMLLRSLLLGLILAVTSLETARSADAPLALEAKIPLGAVNGRIDHLAIDLNRQRLFVAELGNDSLGMVDLVTRTLFRRIAGLREPQGVGYEPMTDTVYVANANDGSVRLFKGEDLSEIGRIELGSARTSLFVPELDRLYLAVRSSWSESPAIWVFRPAT